MRYIFALLVSCAASVACAGPLTFRAVPDSQTGINAQLETWRNGKTGDAWWPWSVVNWDQDGDGKPDLLLTTHSGAGSMLLRQGDNLSFVDVTESLGLKKSQMPWQIRPIPMDVNGDGKVDVVPCIEGSLPIIVNRGDRLELGSQVSEVRSRFGQMVDLNKDGRPDWLQFVREYGKTARVEYLNTGSGFKRSSSVLPIPTDIPDDLVARLKKLEAEDPRVTPTYNPQGPNRYAGPLFQDVDLNGDGRIDRVLSYGGSYAAGVEPDRCFGVYLLRDESDTLLDQTADLGIPGHLMPLLPTRDVTGDGRPDVLTIYGAGAGLYVQQPDGKFFLSKKDGLGDLSTFVTPTTGSYPYTAHFHDFDNDGDDDLLVSRMRLTGLRIYENRGAGEFVLSLSAWHWDAEGFRVCDINRDGLLDLVTGGPPPGGKWRDGTTSQEGAKGDNQVTIWLNVTEAPVPPPPDPEPDPPVEPEPPVDPPKPSAPKVKITIDGQELEAESIEIIVKRKPAPEPPVDPPVDPPVEPEPPVDPPPTEPEPPTQFKLRHPLDSLDTESPKVKEWLAWVRATPTVRRFYLAFAYRLTRDEEFATRATQGLSVQSVKDAVAAGKQPEVTADSYFWAGEWTENIVYPLAWCGHRIPAETKAELEALVKQVTFNLRYPSRAKFYDKPYAWNGWGTDNPGNNYFYAGLTAHTLWALYSEDADWLTYLKVDRFAKVAAQMAALPEGGSREGTGYGTSHRVLFGVYDLWAANTGERIADQTTHAKATLELWANLIQPGGIAVAPIGDQARDTKGLMDNTVRALINRGASLYPTSPEARHALWAASMWPTITRKEDSFDDLWPYDAQPEAPQSLGYSAAGVGWYTAVSSRELDAVALTFQAGKIWESHAAQSQGHFDLYGKGGWLLSTNNVRSRSGINQETTWQNLVVIRSPSGAVVPQDKPSSVVVANVTDDGETWRASCELGPTYKSVPGIKWRRELTFKRPGRISVSDLLTLPTGYAATWQVNTPLEPVVVDDVVTVGKLRMAFSRPEAPPITVKDWRKITNEALGGWRIEVQGVEFLVEMEVLP